MGSVVAGSVRQVGGDRNVVALPGGSKLQLPRKKREKEGGGVSTGFGPNYHHRRIYRGL